MAQSLETLFVDLRARTKILERDLDKANRTIARKMKVQGRRMADDMSAGFSKAFGKLAAFTGVTVGLAGLQAAIRSTVQESSQLQTTADKLGLTTTALQELRYAGEKFNINQTTTDMALQRFSRRLAEAAQGTGELKGTLEQYGIAARDSEGNMRSTIDVLRDYADVVKNAESQQEQLRLAFKAFDSEGVSFVNILRDGAEGLSRLRVEAHAFGQVIEAENIRRIDQLNAQLTRFKGGWKTVFTSLVGGALNLSDALGITGLEGQLAEIEKKIHAANAAAATLAEPKNISPFVFSGQLGGLGDIGDLNRLQMERQVVLAQIVEESHEAFESLGRIIDDARQMQDQFAPDDPAYQILAERIRILSDEYGNLGQQQVELMMSHPESIALFEELAAVVNPAAEAVGLTATEMARLKSIMLSTITPSEKLEEEMDLLNKAIEAFPEKAADYEQAMQRIKAAYEESLQPDALDQLPGKMDELLETWQQMADGMSSSLSEALLEGGDSVGRFLQRTLQRLAAASLNDAILSPLLSSIGLGGGKSPFLFGFAGGGRPPVGSPYIVGEKGPEIRVDDRPGAILPNHVLRGLSGSGGGGSQTIHQTINFNTDLMQVRDQISQAAPLISQATQAAIADQRRRRPF